MALTVITGASSGIGRALAHRLASGGETIVALARREALLASLVAEIRAGGGLAYARTCDVTDRHQVLATFAEIATSLGPVERLIANAGGGARTHVADFSSERIRAVLDLNVVGTAHCIEAVLPGMRARRSGHLVAMASLAGLRGLPQAAGYSAAKAALIAMMESLRIDLKPDGIAVTVLLPGFVRVDPEKKRRKPFAMALDDATARMARAIHARRPLAAFPLPLSLAAHGARLLPARLYDRAFAKKG